MKPKKLERVWALAGFVRSLAMYYGRPWQGARLRRFYSQFIGPGDLCFDIGAHVGNRTRAWLHLGAQVVAVEPQPDFVRWLTFLFADHPHVKLIAQAVGATPGQAQLYLSRRTPTVTTLSAAWMTQVRQADSFANVRWDDSIPVAVTTLDALMAQYGVPGFCKIDVEGFELAVLRGLSQPLPCLSVEYIPATVDIALGCVDRLTALGDYQFNVSQGEKLRWRWPAWVTAAELTAWLETLPPNAPSGDIYARRR